MVGNLLDEETGNKKFVFPFLYQHKFEYLNYKGCKGTIYISITKDEKTHMSNTEES